MHKSLSAALPYHDYTLVRSYLAVFVGWYADHDVI